MPAGFSVPVEHTCTVYKYGVDVILGVGMIIKEIEKINIHKIRKREIEIEITFFFWYYYIFYTFILLQKI